jgi:peroxiredoxin
LPNFGGRGELVHLLPLPIRLCTGKTYFGNERTTFVVDSAGKVAEVLLKVKPAEHDALVLAALDPPYLGLPFE